MECSLCRLDQHELIDELSDLVTEDELREPARIEWVNVKRELNDALDAEVSLTGLRRHFSEHVRTGGF